MTLISPITRTFRFTRFFLPIIFFIGIACQKVVDIDLNEAEPHIVIEGTIADTSGIAIVSITKTGTYFEPALSFPPVTLALVTIADISGNIDTLTEKFPGVYHSNRTLGNSGQLYTLSVLAEGKLYTAVSLMPKKVTIDSLLVEKGRQRGMDDENEGPGYEITLKFTDPPEQKNYYRLNIRATTRIPEDSIDGRRFRLYSDKLTNGNVMTEKFHINGKIAAGDTVTIEFISLDKAAFDYFSTLRDIMSSDRSPTSLAPANPNSNMSNGSLGYFSAYMVDRRILIMK